MEYNWKFLAWIFLALLVAGGIATGLYFWLKPSTSATNKPTKEGIKSTFRSSTLQEDKGGVTNRSYAREDNDTELVNKYIVPTNITGKVAAAVFPFECAMEYDATNFTEGHTSPEQSVQPNNKEDGKKAGVEIIGTYRPDQSVDQMTFYDFDLRTGADVTEGQQIQIPEGAKGCTSRMMIMLFAYIDLEFKAFGKDYTVRIAMSDYDPLNLKRGDKQLLDSETGTFRWYDLETSTFVTERPSKAQVIPGIRDFVRMDTDKTVFYPLHVLLKQQADFTNIETMKGVSVEVDFELQKFIVIVGEGTREVDDTMKDADLLALTSIVQANYEFNHNGRDVNGNGRPPSTDELPFDHHFMPTDENGLPVPFGGFQIDPQGTLVHPGGYAPPFVPGERDQVYPGNIEKSTTTTNTSVGGRLLAARGRHNNREDDEPEQFVAHLEHLENWDPLQGPPPPPADFNWVQPPPGQFYVPDGFFDNGHAKPPPPPSFMPPPEHYAFNQENNTSYAELGVMPDGSRFGPPPQLPPPIPPPPGCGCGADPFRGMPGLFATTTVTMFEKI